MDAENADLREENEDPQKQLDTIADIVAPPDQDEDDDLDDGEAAEKDGDDDQD